MRSLGGNHAESRDQKKRAGKRKRLTVYIESTIPSYLTARPAKDLVKRYRQLKTREWWDAVFPKVDAVISDYVLDEIRVGDPDAARRRLEVLQGIQVLAPIDEITPLAHKLQSKLQIPQRAQLDAFHLAFAMLYEVDYVLSWNFEHIVGGPVKKPFAEVAQELGLSAPTLCTPEELMEVEPL